MSDKWIIAVIIAGVILLGVVGLAMNGAFKTPHDTFKMVNGEIVDSPKAKESESLNIKIKSLEKGTLHVSISKAKNEDKNDVEFDIVFDSEGNVTNNLDNLTEDEALQEEITKVVEKCTNEKLYMVDSVSQSYSSYYSKR